MTTTTAAAASLLVFGTLLLTLCLPGVVSAFVVSPILSSQQQHTSHLQPGHSRSLSTSLPTSLSTSIKLQAASLQTNLPNSNNDNQKRPSLSIRQLIIRFINIFRKFLYPHTIPPTTSSSSSSNNNEASKAPLAASPLGCPFFGSFVFEGDSQTGIGKFYRTMSQKLNNPGIFNVSFLGAPLTIVYGLDNMKNVLDREFKSAQDGGISTGQMASSQAAIDIFGQDSLLRSTNKNEHSWLRKLVGKSMNPASVAKSIPQLVKGTELALQQMIEKGGIPPSGTGVVMEDICTAYTLDVAWRQILGLSLTKDEESVFRKAVGDWIIGIINPFLMIIPSFLVKRSKSYRARKYLDNLILSKIDDLKQNGPDGSTLSAMVYATDDDDDDDGKEGSDSKSTNTSTTIHKQSLSQKQIMDNALLLILAGSETSASTLTTAMMFLGLYPEVYKKIQKEQQDLQDKYGPDAELTKQMLDEMTFLDAFIRETTRIKPLNQGAPRFAKESIVVDGKQIPKDWTVFCNVLLTHTFDPKTLETDGEGNNMDIYKGFKPERWLDEETKPAAWMAFGYGPRFCLGYNLAMAEMKVFLALVARNVEFSLVNGTEDIKWQKMSIIPKPKDGTLISVTAKN